MRWGGLCDFETCAERLLLGRQFADFNFAFGPEAPD
jgi:hypothetical protein